MSNMYALKSGQEKVGTDSSSTSTNYEKLVSDSFVSRKITLYGKISDKIGVDFGGRGSFSNGGPV